MDSPWKNADALHVKLFVSSTSNLTNSYRELSDFAEHLQALMGDVRLYAAVSDDDIKELLQTCAKTVRLENGPVPRFMANVRNCSNAAKSLGRSEMLGESLRCVELASWLAEEWALRLYDFAHDMRECVEYLQKNGRNKARTTEEGASSSTETLTENPYDAYSALLGMSDKYSENPKTRSGSDRPWKAETREQCELRDLWLTMKRGSKEFETIREYLRKMVSRLIEQYFPEDG